MKKKKQKKKLRKALDKLCKRKMIEIEKDVWLNGAGTVIMEYADARWIRV